MVTNLTISEWTSIECNSNTTSNISDIVLANNTLPSDLAVPLYGYSLPFIVLITAVANTLIVAVLVQRPMRTPTNVLLIAISLSDLMTLITPAPIFFYMYALGHHRNPIYPIPLCYTWYFFFDIFPNTFHTTSIWLTLALGVQRYIYVCHPPMARVYCNVKRVTKVIACIVASASLHQGLRFFEFRYDETCVVWDHKILSACNIFYSKWIWNHLNLYYGSYFWFRVFFVHLGPCTILIVLNLLLFKALRKAEIKRRKMVKENKKKECLKLRDSNCTTLMLIVILSVFLITEIPLAVITLLHIFSSQGYINFFTPDEYHIIQKYFIVSNFFITVSYPINFAIYCGMSRQFLETFKETFVRRGFFCKKKVIKPSALASQRSSVSAISFKQRHSSMKIKPQCCISTIDANDHSPEPSSKEELDNNFLRPQVPRADADMRLSTGSGRSVSFILEEAYSRPRECSVAQQETEFLIVQDHVAADTPSQTTKIIQETQI
ncbi:UNVERIFIED_CONTAM: hypothetical protein GTU68_011148 [Idotea baltica]|nr:hypothetical protein [Idotea baltica]